MCPGSRDGQVQAEALRLNGAPQPERFWAQAYEDFVGTGVVPMVYYWLVERRLNFGENGTLCGLYER